LLIPGIVLKSRALSWTDAKAFPTVASISASACSSNATSDAPAEPAGVRADAPMQGVDEFGAFFARGAPGEVFRFASLRTFWMREKRRMLITY
jgi:hypothetical protein